MYKNSTFKTLLKVPVARGFTLIELQIYLALLAIMVVLICHVVLMYHNLYDTTALKAQKSVLMLAAVRKVNETCDHAVTHQKKDGLFSAGSLLKGAQLLSGLTRHKMVLLEGVSQFDCTTDIRNKTLCGVTFLCNYGGRTITWYRASPTKAFSCS